MAPETLNEVTTTAAALNRETDEFNAVIRNVEARLSTAGVGVSVWLGAELAASDWEEASDSHTEETWEECTLWRLGYAKIRGEWRVAVKRVKLVRHNDHEVTVTEPIALVDAPRAVRIEAASYLDDLGKALARRMREYVDEIGKAKSAKN